MTRLNRDFYNDPTQDVAQKLIGKVMVFKGVSGVITETEAYIGQDDPACHAAKGKTPRTEVMFGKPGVSYVYFIYGMYHCLNFVTEREGFPAAVLVRGLKLLGKSKHHLNGPGKICRDLGINREHNKHDLIDSSTLYVEDQGITLPYEKTPRIGIKVGTDKLWRFVVSKPFLDF